MVKEYLLKMVAAYKKLEEAIMDALPGGDVCNCERKLWSVEVVHHGNLFNEIMKYCLNCGGLQE